MGLRPGKVDRKLERAYTRTSVRVHKKGYIKGVPGSKLNKFDMGMMKEGFDVSVSLLPKEHIQIRHNAIESARISANAYLRKHMAEEEYAMKIRVFPHQILREHAQAAVAQADRFFQGMRKPFGKAIGRAAQVRKDQPIMTIKTTEKFRKIAEEAIRRARMKIPMGGRCVVE